MAKSHSSTQAPNQKVKLICSYGGKIQPAPVGNKLLYSGGDNKILTVDRNIKFDDFIRKVNSVSGVDIVGSGSGGGGSIKYQLPGEDLNVLISLTNDDDLDNMMFEYDRLHRILSPVKTVRIRLFLNLEKPNFVDSGSVAPLNPDYLFGFDKELDYNRVCDDHELEHWKIPRAVDDQNTKSPESDDQIGSCNSNTGEALVQSEKRDGHVGGGGGGNEQEVAVPQGFCWVPGSLGFQVGQMGSGRTGRDNGGGSWGEQPSVYIFVPSMPATSPEQTTVSRC